MLPRHLAHCRVKQLGDLRWISKQSSSSPRKIDAAVAAVVAFDRAAHVEPPAELPQSFCGTLVCTATGRGVWSSPHLTRGPMVGSAGVRRGVARGMVVVALVSAWSLSMVGVAWGLPRKTVDRVDDSKARQIHVVYAVARGGHDRRLDVDGTLGGSVASFNRWLASQTSGRRLRMDTRHGKLDITFVRLPRTDAQYAGQGAFARDLIETDLDASGFTKPKKKYAVYYDGTSTFSCGGAAWPPTVPGQDAVMYLKGTPLGSPPCAMNTLAGASAPPGYWEYAMLHDLLHTLGLVAVCAPNQWRSGHVPEPSDLMYAGDTPWTFPLTLDIGRDDYYQASVPGCPSLETSGFLRNRPTGARQEGSRPWPMRQG